MHPASGQTAGDAGRLVAGRYRLAEQIGRGAMGIVWRGRDELLDRYVAVKQVQLAPSASAAEAQVSHQRMLREARSAARLSHPSVVTVYDVVEEDASPWIIMELVTARPLDLLIAEDGPLRPAQAARLGEMLLGALAAAHAAGVLHRDVKPGNVLITPDGRAVLTDFGIATVEGDPGLTQSGMVVGTPGFSPPERVRGLQATPASDLWSLGATLYSAVEGRSPFDRPGGTSAIIAAVATEAAPRAPSAGPLAPVIEALLRADPALRPDAGTAAGLLAQAASAASGPASLQLPAHQLAEAGTAPAPAFPRPRELPGPAAPPDFMGGSPAPGWPRVLPAVADLRMPAPGAHGLPDAAGPGGTPGQAAALGSGARPEQNLAGGAGAGGLPGRRIRADGRFRVGAAAAAAALAVTGVLVWLSYAALPGLIGSQGVDRLPAAPLSTGAAARQAGPGSVRGSARSDAPGSGGLRGARAAHGAAGAPGPRGSGGSAAAPGGSPAPSQHGSSPAGPPGSPSPSLTARPSPSPRPGPRPPPAGYYWQTVRAAGIGTTAGYRLAVPDGWQMGTLGVATTFSAPSGRREITVDLTPFVYSDPVQQARYLEGLLKAVGGTGYHLVALRAGTFRGQHMAIWRYRYTAAGGTAKFAAEALVTLPTSAGPQSYALSVAAGQPLRGTVPALLSTELGHFTPVA